MSRVLTREYGGRARPRACRSKDQVGNGQFLRYFSIPQSTCGSTNPAQLFANDYSSMDPSVQPVLVDRPRPFPLAATRSMPIFLASTFTVSTALVNSQASWIQFRLFPPSHQVFRLYIAHPLHSTSAIGRLPLRQVHSCTSHALTKRPPPKPPAFPSAKLYTL